MFALPTASLLLLISRKQQRKLYGWWKKRDSRHLCLLMASYWLPAAFNITLASSHLFSLATVVCFSKILNWVFSVLTLVEPALMGCSCSVSLFRYLGPDPMRLLLQAKRYQHRSRSTPSQVLASALGRPCSKFVYLQPPALGW